MTPMARLGALVLLTLVGCGRETPPSSPPATAAQRVPAILLVTLDTTRADAIGPEAVGIRTPAFDAISAGGRRFRYAYAAVPETLPSHVSMMTGLYPGGHGLHENGRVLPASQPVLAERLHQAGYRTAAFVSSFILARRFGLARGFDVYDDTLPVGRAERTAEETTTAALAHLQQEPRGPLFLWVHYFDPHHPYEPPERFRRRYPGKPYLGEVAAMDEQLGRLLDAFRRWSGGEAAVVVVSDHGEGLGEHGESQHGNLLYQPTMRVPLVIAGPGVAPSVADAPVSTRRVFHTILDWAGIDAAHSLRVPGDETVMGEAMKPFLEYGWQPQVMAVRGREKAVLAGRMEMFDVVADPLEARDLASDPARRPATADALRDYPVPSPDTARPPEQLDPEARRRLASLGYVSAGAAPVVRKDAPRPADMVGLFDLLDRASGLFVAGRYQAVIPLLERILARDPNNLDAMLRLATAHSALGHQSQAMDAFQRASRLAPESLDVQTYLALHYARGRNWEQAVPILEAVLARSPDRLAALEGLASLRVRQNRVDEALALTTRIHALRQPSGDELARTGLLAMQVGKTAAAIEALEKARALQGAAFAHDLELGLLYFDARHYEEAGAALDRVPASHPERAIALYKRAQVSVLRDEPDRAARIAAARAGADAATRELIGRDRLFSR